MGTVKATVKSEKPDPREEREYVSAVRRGEKGRAAGLRATWATYDATQQRVVLELINGYSFGIPLARLPEIASASARELAAVEVVGAGSILHWEALDADYSIPALITTGVGTASAAREFARRGGRATSEAKAAAARANGAKGGRPRKNKATPR